MNSFIVCALVIILWVIIVVIDGRSQKKSEESQKRPVEPQKKQEEYPKRAKAPFVLFKTKRDKVLAVGMAIVLCFFLARHQIGYIYKLYRCSRQVEAIEKNNFSESSKNILNLASYLEGLGDSLPGKYAYKLASRLYIPLSEKGNGQASYAQAKLLRDKLYQDTVTYIPYLETAAKQGYPQGQIDLARYYYNEGKKKESYNLLNQAAQKAPNLVDKFLESSNYSLDDIAKQVKLKPELRKIVRRQRLETATAFLRHEVLRLGREIGTYAESTNCCCMASKPQNGQRWQWRPEEKIWQRTVKEKAYSYSLSVQGVLFLIYGKLHDADGRPVLQFLYGLGAGKVGCFAVNTEGKELCRSLGGVEQASEGNKAAYELPDAQRYNVSPITCDYGC